MPGICTPFEEYSHTIEEYLNYTVHRVGTCRDHERLYGPYPSRVHAEVRLKELTENLIREHAEPDEAKVVHRSSEKVVVILKDPELPLGNRRKVKFFYFIKPMRK